MGFIWIIFSLLEKIFFARCWLIYVCKWSFDVCSPLLPVSFRRLKFPFRVRIERAHSIRAYRLSSGIFIAFDRPFILPSGSFALIIPLVPHLRTEVGWSRRAHPPRIERVFLTSPWIFHLSLLNLSLFNCPDLIYDRKKAQIYKNSYFVKWISSIFLK